MKNLIKLLRPQQWLKNGFIFLPLFFSGQMGDVQNWINCVVAFFSFCFAASAVYCFNDIYDAEDDRLHAGKRNRPIASGAISKKQGYLIMGLMMLLSFILLFLIDNSSNAMIVIGIYFIMNMFYCIKLKHIYIVDVFIIAFGFVLRVLAGGVATGIQLSHWIILMTFLLALFLAFAKRRDDVVVFQDTGVKIRKSIKGYSLRFLDQVLSIVGTITVVCYIMYTVSGDVTKRFESQYVYLTSIFVLAGIIRYMQISIVAEKSGDPTKVLVRDLFIQGCIIGWLIAFSFIIYF